MTVDRLKTNPSDARVIPLRQPVAPREEAPEESHKPSLPIEGPTAYLTAEGRAILAEHLAELRNIRIPALIAAIHDRDRDGRVDAEYVRTLREASRIDELIRSAGDVNDLPRARNVVALGDRVAIMLESGDRQDFMIVDPVEAPLDRVRISSESPLSKALLGSGLGSEVTVQAPSGPYRCVIIGINRHRAPRGRTGG